VVVGVRRYSPAADVGRYSIEEHDTSPTNGANLFRHLLYHARDVAEQMMRQNNGVLILSSATP